MATTTQKLFLNQNKINDKIEKMDKEIQDLGEKVLEDSKNRKQEDRTAIATSTQKLFSNQDKMNDKIEKVDKEIQDLGEKVLEIPSLIADETRNDSGFTFYNDSIKSIKDENEDEDEYDGLNNDHIKDWIEKIDKNVITEDENENNGFNFYNDSVKMETDGDEDKVDDDGEHVIPWHSTPRGKSSRQSILTDQSIII